MKTIIQCDQNEQLIIHDSDIDNINYVQVAIKIDDKYTEVMVPMSDLLGAIEGFNIYKEEINKIGKE
jgi:hypothetical protein